MEDFDIAYGFFRGVVPEEFKQEPEPHYEPATEEQMALITERMGGDIKEGLMFLFGYPYRVEGRFKLRDNKLRVSGSIYGEGGAETEPVARIVFNDVLLEFADGELVCNQVKL